MSEKKVREKSLDRDMTFVTGSAGFIGSNFVEMWLDKKKGSVISFDKLTYAGNKNNLKSFIQNSKHTFFEGDICQTEKLLNIFREYEPKYIVNFAAETHVDRSINYPNKFFKNNVIGTLSLFEACRQYYAELPDKKKTDFRILQISTDEVYGSLSLGERSFTEKNRYKPNSPYSASKASGDHIARSYSVTFSLPVLISNCSNNYGPFQHPEKLIPLAILNLLSERKVPVYGDGRQIRDWIFVKDNCEAQIKILENGINGEVYNVGGGNEKENIEVLELLCEILQEIKPSLTTPYKDLISFVEDRPGHDYRYSMDFSKMSNQLGWKPKESFRTGLQKTVEWYLGNPDWVKEILGKKTKPSL